MVRHETRAQGGKRAKRGFSTLPGLGESGEAEQTPPTRIPKTPVSRTPVRLPAVSASAPRVDPASDQRPQYGRGCGALSAKISELVDCCVCVRQVKQGKWEPESDRVVRSWATACFPVAVLPTGDAILWCCGPVAELPISRVTAWEVARLHGVQAGEDWARGRDESGACRARVASARREASSGGVFSAA